MYTKGYTYPPTTVRVRKRGLGGGKSLVDDINVPSRTPRSIFSYPLPILGPGGMMARFQVSEGVLQQRHGESRRTWVFMHNGRPHLWINGRVDALLIRCEMPEEAWLADDWETYEDIYGVSPPVAP